jgi:hypothetical protein
MKVGELFVQLGIQADTPKAKEFESAMMGAALKASGLIAALAGVTLEIRDMVHETLAASVGFQKFENQTGLAAEKLQQWHNMAERANVSTEDVTSSIMNLQRNMAEIKLGRGNIAPFQMLGLPLNKDPFQLLLDIQDRIRGLDRPMAVNLLQQLGISPDMINLLGRSRAELEALASPRMILSPQNVAKVLQAQRALKELRIELTAFSRMFIADIAPAIVLFSGFITNLGGAVHSVVEYLKEFPTAMKLIADSIILVMAVLNPWIAALSAALLLMEDYYVYMKGGKSVFGELLGPHQNTKPGVASNPNWKYSGTGSWVDQLFLKWGLVGPKIPKFQNNKVDIHVNTAANAHETAQETKKVFDSAISSAEMQLNNEGN